MQFVRLLHNLQGVSRDNRIADLLRGESSLQRFTESTNLDKLRGESSLQRFTESTNLDNVTPSIVIKFEERSIREGLNGSSTIDRFDEVSNLENLSGSVELTAFGLISPDDFPIIFGT